MILPTINKTLEKPNFSLNSFLTQIEFKYEHWSLPLPKLNNHRGSTFGKYNIDVLIDGLINTIINIIVNNKMYLNTINLLIAISNLQVNTLL